MNKTKVEQTMKGGREMVADEHIATTNKNEAVGEKSEFYKILTQYRPASTLLDDIVKVLEGDAYKVSKRGVDALAERTKQDSKDDSLEDKIKRITPESHSTMEMMADEYIAATHKVTDKEVDEHIAALKEIINPDPYKVFEGSISDDEADGMSTINEQILSGEIDLFKCDGWQIEGSFGLNVKSDLFKGVVSIENSRVFILSNELFGLLAHNLKGYEGSYALTENGKLMPEYLGYLAISVLVPSKVEKLIRTHFTPTRVEPYPIIKTNSDKGFCDVELNSVTVKEVGSKDDKVDSNWDEDKWSLEKTKWEQKMTIGVDHASTPDYSCSCTIMVSKIPFKCPYNEFSCVHVDTCGMSVEKSCKECEHSHNETRATGAMPGLEWIWSNLKKLVKKSKIS
jgi:hypothetical protein